MEKRQSKVPLSFVLMLFEYLQEHDLPAESLLGMSAPQLPNDGMGVFALDRWVDMLDKAAEALGDPVLGLHLGQRAQPRHLGVVAYLCSSLPTLGEAALSLEAYQRLIYDPTPMLLRGGRGYVDMLWDAEHGRPGQLADECALSAMIQFTRQLCSQPAHPILIGFINPAPSEPALYEEFFGCPVLFDQSFTQVRLKQSDLAIPLRTADPTMRTMMEAQADKLLASLPQEVALLSEVRRHISHLLHDTQTNCDAVARRMHMSRRSLQRALAAENTSFRDEVATVRAEMARQYLRDSGLRIADIAQLLGYAEQSVFSRSFQRWQGCTPQQFRAMEA